MDRAVFDRMAALDGEHWWFVARRKILGSVIERVVKPPRNARILELGCGTGHNLAMLARFGAVEASELDDRAREIATARLGQPVKSVALPDLSQFEPASYDLIALLDVLEHVPDDSASLAAILGLLKPGGALLLTVPANPWMWSAHDVAHHHHRRYRKAGIAALAAAAGFRIDLLSPFNSLLFPPIAAARALGKWRGDKTGGEGDDAMPPPLLNRALEMLFAAERHLIGRVGFPAGVSLISVLRRPAS